MSVAEAAAEALASLQNPAPARLDMQAIASVRTLVNRAAQASPPRAAQASTPALRFLGEDRAKYNETRAFLLSKDTESKEHITHCNLNGAGDMFSDTGKWHVPDYQKLAVYAAIAWLRTRGFPLYFNERQSPVFPLIEDLDLDVPLHLCGGPEELRDILFDDQLLFLKERVNMLHKVFPAEGAIRVVVCCSNGFHRGKQKWKVSYHFIWLDLHVNGNLAALIRLLTIFSIKAWDERPGSYFELLNRRLELLDCEWDTVLDDTTSHATNGLRLLFNDKISTHKLPLDAQGRRKKIRIKEKRQKVPVGLLEFSWPDGAAEPQARWERRAPPVEEMDTVEMAAWLEMSSCRRPPNTETTPWDEEFVWSNFNRATARIPDYKTWVNTADFQNSSHAVRAGRKQIDELQKLRAVQQYVPPSSSSEAESAGNESAESAESESVESESAEREEPDLAPGSAASLASPDPKSGSTVATEGDLNKAAKATPIAAKATPIADSESESESAVAEGAPMQLQCAPMQLQCDGRESGAPSRPARGAKGARKHKVVQRSHLGRDFVHFDGTADDFVETLLAHLRPLYLDEAALRRDFLIRRRACGVEWRCRTPELCSGVEQGLIFVAEASLICVDGAKLLPWVLSWNRPPPARKGELVPNAAIAEKPQACQACGSGVAVSQWPSGATCGELWGWSEAPQEFNHDGAIPPPPKRPAPTPPT